jgi:hypothetical protein
VTIDSVTIGHTVAHSNSGGTSAGTVFRRIAACAVNGICIFLLLFGPFLHALDSLVGNSRDAATTFLSIVQAPGVTPGIASTMCDDIATNSPSVTDVIDSRHAECVASVTKTIRNDPAVAALVRDKFREVYKLIESGHQGTVNLAPIVDQVTNNLAADLGLPASSLLPGKTFTISFGSHHAINISNLLETWGWLMIALGFGGAIASARFLVRNRNRQIISVAVTLGVPGLVALLLGVGWRGLADQARYRDPTAKALVQRSADKVASVYSRYGIWLLVADAVVVGVWLLIRQWRRRHAGGATPEGDGSEPAAAGGAAIAR